jgi:hypothetical protein
MHYFPTGGKVYARPIPFTSSDPTAEWSCPWGSLLVWTPARRVCFSLLHLTDDTNYWKLPQPSAQGLGPRRTLHEALKPLCPSCLPHWVVFSWVLCCSMEMSKTVGQRTCLNFCPTCKFPSLSYMKTRMLCFPQHTELEAVSRILKRKPKIRLIPRILVQTRTLFLFGEFPVELPPWLESQAA